MDKQHYYNKHPNLKAVISTYKPADKVVKINAHLRQDGEKYFYEDDPDLKPITINIADFIAMNARFWSPNNPPADIVKPKLEKITGWGKPASEQWFEVPKWPQQLIEAEEKYFDIRHNPKRDDVDGPEYFWRLLYSDPHKYKESLQFIAKMQYHFRYGYWFFCNGKPTYIDGWHFRQLTTFRQGTFMVRNKKTGKPEKVYTPEYRDRARKAFMFYKWCMVDTTDHRGKDFGVRTCFGYVYPKNRRVGATADFLSILLDIMSVPETYNSMIGDSDSTAEGTFQQKFVKAWQRQPVWCKPMNDGTALPKSKLVNDRPGRRASSRLLYKDYMESLVDYANKADRAYYDNKEINGALLCDEEGKCFKRDTKIRMYDGTIKMIQDIQVGDLLMGPDSLPRKVTNTTTGQEEMFDVLPNKFAFDSWGCNRSHILSLKISDKNYGELNSVINVTVDEYLKFSKGKKRVLNLYKSEVKYNHKDVAIDPYFLGVWLGDGCKMSPKITIHNKDVEVIEYLEDYADELSLRFHKSFNSTNSHNYSFYKPLNGPKNNVLTDKLRSYNVLDNKHIPFDFMINSKENRMKLFAGLLDSDGYMNISGNKCNYEISSSKEDFANQIKELADGLGFSASKRYKKAKLKDKYFDSWVVSIYGKDLNDIPTKLPRKQAPKRENRSSKAKDTSKTGFKLESAGMGTYYGVVIDGPDRLFLLKDYQVVHNTLATNILDGWALVKPTMAPGGATQIRKYAFTGHPSTVEEMNSGGGDNYLRLCNMSNYQETSEVTGQTDSGLRLLFIPSPEGLEGYVGKYGESLIENLTEDQKKFIGKKRGSREFIEYHLESQKKKGTIEGEKEYTSFKRKNPVNYRDCWTLKSEGNGFDMEKLQDRIVDLQLSDSPTRQGDFYWRIHHVDYSAKEYLSKFGKHDNPDAHSGTVVWRDNPNGRFRISEMPVLHFQNVKTRSNGRWNCTRTTHVSSADTFDYLKDAAFKKTKNHTKMSKGAGAVFLRRDKRIDPDSKDTSEWKTHRFVCDYVERPGSSDEYCEEMLMMSVFYSTGMFPETNKSVLYQYFEDRGYGGFLIYQVDPKTGRKKDKPGFHSQTGSKQELFDHVRNYIAYHCHKEQHITMLQDFADIKGLDDMTNRDLFVAGAGCLFGSYHLSVYDLDFNEEEEEGEGFDLGDYF